MSEAGTMQGLDETYTIARSLWQRASAAEKEINGRSPQKKINGTAGIDLTTAGSCVAGVV